MKKLAIVQSNYIPWKGYFDLINSVDEFILYDDAQYTERDWRNRNLIKTPQGLHWLTIPVAKATQRRICDVEVSDSRWRREHWESFVRHYSRTTHFSGMREHFESLYLNENGTNLSLINERFIRRICEVLGIFTKISRSMDYRVEGERSEKLLSLCLQAGATSYLSGPSAKNYLDEKIFEKAGVAVSYMDYSNYPIYRQLYPPFEHQVSVLDLLFCEGEGARKFMRTSRG